METKSHKKSKSRLILNLAILALVIVCMIMIAIKWNTNQNIIEIEVTGNYFVPINEIQSISLSIINSVTKDKLKLEQISTELQKHPFILNANITKESPQRIRIELLERTPLAVIAKDSGDCLLVDKYNNILPYLYIEKTCSLPVISDVFVRDSLDTNYLNEAVSILNELKKDKNLALFNEISEIYKNRSESNWYLITHEDNLQLILGKINYIEDKLFNAITSLSYLSEIEKKKFKYIDLRWSNQIITKL